MTQESGLDERNLRFRRIRTSMENEDLAAIILSGHGSGGRRGNIRYFANWHIWDGDAILLIPLAEEPALVFTAYSGGDRATDRWIRDVDSCLYPHEGIAVAMQKRGITSGKVGIAGMKEGLSAGALNFLLAMFPSIEFVSADLIVDRIRSVKSPLEIDQYRELWSLTKKAMNCFIEQLKPGRTQREVTAESIKVLREGGVSADLVLIQEGGRRGLPLDVPLQCNDVVRYYMEMCSQYGHWAEIDVFCAFRKQEEIEHRLMVSEISAYEQIRKIAKPGVKLSELGTKFEELLRKDGWMFAESEFHFDFHGQGMDIIEWPWFSPKPDHNQDVPLEEGMVLSYHPSRNTIPSLEWHRFVHDNILITKNGAERLSGEWDLSWRIMR